MMRENLFEFFRPTNHEFDKIWQSSIVIPDANVLLNILRYNKKSADEVLNLFDSMKDKLWSPHQVSFEFLKNCHSVFISMEKPYDKLDSVYNDIAIRISNEIDKIKSEYRHHPSFEFDEHKTHATEHILSIRANLKEIRQSHPTIKDAESIIDRIAHIFSGKVGSSYKTDDHEFRCSEAKERYSKGTPPGYLDSSKSDGGVGDYIIWRQILDYASENKTNVIFITDDVKEDWWLKVDGRTIGPRPELRREFFQNTGRSFYMYNLARWLELAKSKRKDAVSDETVAEAKARHDRTIKAATARDVQIAEMQRLDVELHERRISLIRRLEQLRSEREIIISDMLKIDEIIYNNNKNMKDMSFDERKDHILLQRKQRNIRDMADYMGQEASKIRAELEDINEEIEKNRQRIIEFEYEENVVLRTR